MHDQRKRTKRVDPLPPWPNSYTGNVPCITKSWLCTVTLDLHNCPQDVRKWVWAVQIFIAYKVVIIGQLVVKT